MLRAVDIRRVFIVGDSLFAESLASLLGKSRGIEVVGSAPTPQAAIPQLAAACPDAAIVAAAGETSAALGQMLAAFPDLPIIRADLAEDRVQVVTSHEVGTRASQLLDVIQALPGRASP